jgi:hypothetical protein
VGLTPGPGIECIDCGFVTETRDTSEPCADCGSKNTQPVVISNCDKNNATCDDMTHHWGYDMHVAIVKP